MSINTAWNPSLVSTHVAPPSNRRTIRADLEAIELFRDTRPSLLVAETSLSLSGRVGFSGLLVGGQEGDEEPPELLPEVTIFERAYPSINGPVVKEWSPSEVEPKFSPVRKREESVDIDQESDPNRVRRINTIRFLPVREDPEVRIDIAPESPTSFPDPYYFMGIDPREPSRGERIMEGFCRAIGSCCCSNVDGETPQKCLFMTGILFCVIFGLIASYS